MKNFPSAHIFLTLLMVCVLCYAPLSAQTLDSTKADSVQKPRENWYWVQGGIGIDSRMREYPIELGLSMAFNTTLLTTKIHLRPDGADGPSSFDIGAMYGRMNRNDWTFSSVSVGLSYTSLTIPWNGGTKNTIGIIGEAQIALKAFVPGVGLKLYANLNLLTPCIAGMLVFHLGWMP